MSDDPPTAEDLERLLLGADRTHDRDDVVAEVGITVEEARKYWRALGFPDVGESIAFTDEDVRALAVVAELVRLRTLDDETTERLVRALGRTTARLAEWQVETLAEVVEAAEATGLGTGSRLTTAYLVAQRVLPEFERLLVYSWRRHLAAAAGRMVAAGTDRVNPLLSANASVGFADLVSFTRLSRGLTEDALAHLVEQFETAAADIVAAEGARLVKTLGDEVLFVADRPATAAAVACGLVDAIGGHPDLPDVRVGIATGAVLSRLGDVFGTPVNLASRLTALAERNVVLADVVTAEALGGDSAYAVRAQPPAEVRGLGVVQPFAVARRSPR
ncbi:MAG TPA: adenylate/guanylate cyclase domain-containing protein [Jiangellales bacterium]|nr:adenylate/guanylate cyclase domain-containing protein [Jiangellales bacterium]